jgi:hypothetical protein
MTVTFTGVIFRPSACIPHRTVTLGSGIYLYGVLPTCDPNFYGNYSFVLDDGPRHTFEHNEKLDKLRIQVEVAKFQYNVLC